MRALSLNWAIVRTDAHAKNCSLLHAPGSFLGLAPLYDPFLDQLASLIAGHTRACLQRIA